MKRHANEMGVLACRCVAALWRSAPPGVFRAGKNLPVHPEAASWRARPSHSHVGIRRHRRHFQEHNAVA